jgi:hypothetical protein
MSAPVVKETRSVGLTCPDGLPVTEADVVAYLREIEEKSGWSRASRS